MEKKVLLVEAQRTLSQRSSEATNYLINVEDVVSRQLSFAHGTHHNVAKRCEMFLADRDVGIGGLCIEVDVENLCDRLLHFHEPLLANIVNGVLVAIDDVARSVSTIVVVLILLSIVGALKLRGCRESFAAFV